MQTGKKKNMLLLLGVLLMAIGSAAASYGGSVVLPGKLSEIGGMGYYSICTIMSPLGMMMALPVVGTLCSRFGRKNVTIAGILIQFLTRLGAMFITSVPIFMIVWFLSYAGAGLYVSAPHAIIPEFVDQEEKTKYYGYLATATAIGSLLGPVLVGTLMDSGRSNLAFVSYSPLVLAGLVCLAISYSNRPGGQQARFDFAGMALLMISIASFVFWLSLGGKNFGWFSPFGILLLAAGSIGSVLLVCTELRTSAPAFPVKIFRHKRFRAVFLCQMLLVSYGTCLAGYAIVYVQQVMQASSLVSSTVTMPQTLVQAVFGIVIGGFVGKAFTKRFRAMALLGLGLYAGALLLLVLLRPDSSIGVIYLAATMGGFGQAINQSTFSPFFQSELDRSEIGTAQAMYSFASSGGSCIFGALCGTVLNQGGSYNRIFLLGLLFCGVALLIAIFTFRLSDKPSQ